MIEKEIITAKVKPTQIAVEQPIPTSIPTPSTVTVSTDNSVKRKRELPKSSSLGDMFKDLHKAHIIEDKIQKVELTIENLQILWTEFLDKNKETLQNTFMNVAREQNPQLIEEKIVFTASNNISLEMLQLHKMDIATYLRNHTTSTVIALEFVLQKTEHTKEYKNPKDRLKDIINTNPAVLNFIQKFDLNLD